MQIFADISENVQKGRMKAVKELVEAALAEGISAERILSEALVPGMGVIGERFKNGKAYVPEVLMAARAMTAGTELLKPHLAAAGAVAAGRVCIGTVQGDLHDIGKNLVRMMMEGKGLEVIDLGTDVPAEEFVRCAVEKDCRIICCSALLTTTMDVMADVVRAAEAAGIRDKVYIMVGGAPISEEFCREIGADCYAADAATAADAAVAYCREKAE
ncbi:MAG: cobalamin-dependent protein [Clostridia bacterium]|nr:cobalamin-dependent protein [Clostridia bacterium]